jgi:hypothetical protein
MVIVRRTLVIAWRRSIVATGMTVVRAVITIAIRRWRYINLRAIAAVARVIGHTGRQGQSKHNKAEQTTVHGGLLDR